MAILGQGVVLGWRHMIDACIDEGLLVRATRESASHGGGYYIVSPNDRAHNQAARLFTRWVFEQAQTPAASMKRVRMRYTHASMRIFRFRK